ncbi:MAG: deoxyhypusine synthase family protein [Proteobacteria bacterium]|nr:deoxyhypusine synthase family protein [Pseudomonadota bacterium]
MFVFNGVLVIKCDDFLVKNKHIHAFVCTAGGIEEDLIKTMQPFLLGRFDLSGAGLHAKGINRAGNILIPNERYLHFELFMNEFLEKMYQKQKELGRPLCTSELIRELGLAIPGEKKEESILYWP